MPEYCVRHFRRWLFASLLAIALLPPAKVLSQDKIQAEGLALLRAAAAARSKVQSCRVELTMTYNPSAGEDGVYKIVIEQSRGNRRVECLPGSREAAVYILSPDHVRRFIRSPAEDLSIFTIKDAGGRYGVMLFDARGLGLSGSFAISDTIDGLFWLDMADSVAMNGVEAIGNTTASRVVVKSAVGTSEYWISPSDFRVHRRTVQWPSGQVATIDSVFNNGDKTSVFPTAIHVANSGKYTDIIDVEVARFESNAVIDQSRFEDASIGMPPNTMRNDYRNNRITGYWDGETFREDPVSPREAETLSRAITKKTNPSWWRYLPAGIVVLASGALATAVWMRRLA